MLNIKEKRSLWLIMMNSYLMLKGYGGENNKQKWQQFPEKFEEINDASTKGTSWIEQTLISRINTFNPKLNIKKIKYYDKDINKKFPDFETGISCGAIIERKQISKTEIDFYKSKDYYTNTDNLIAEKIIEYVYILPTNQKARNSFVSQTVFPSLIDYMGKYLASPSYTIANHKFMLINLDKDKIKANSILNSLIAFIYSGMDYVSLFPFNDISVKNLNIKCFINQIYPKQIKKEKKDEVYVNDFYYINLNKKTLKIKSGKLNKAINMSKGVETFKGSEEKFYWAQILPILIIASFDNYKVDFTEYRDFCKIHKNKFGSSNKMNRCLVLLKFIEKIVIEGK